MRSNLKASRKMAARLSGQSRYCCVAAAVMGSLGAAAIGGIASNRAANKAADASKAAIEANAYQGEIAKDQYDYYKSTYRPLEEKMAKEAENYDSQEAYDQAASNAQANVNSQIGLAKDRLRRTPGMDPSSAAAQAAATDMDLKGAALGASEANKSRENIKNMAYARKQDAIALGKGLVSNASQGLASAASGADAIARSQSALAGQTAQGIGSMVSGTISSIAKAGGFNFGGSSATLAKPPAAPADMDWGVMMEPYRT